jgi:hypothetical protein
MSGFEHRFGTGKASGSADVLLTGERLFRRSNIAAPHIQRGKKEYHCDGA